ncbi:hypothetical protein J4456_03565 [Candidatus Pacearchaeota archaeon]|nr:hypothetical protein [Candidatus Pacearchaeota archaeon]
MTQEENKKKGCASFITGSLYNSVLMMGGYWISYYVNNYHLPKVAEVKIVEEDNKKVMRVEKIVGRNEYLLEDSPGHWISFDKYKQYQKGKKAEESKTYESELEEKLNELKLMAEGEK